MEIRLNLWLWSMFEDDYALKCFFSCGVEILRPPPPDAVLRSRA